jgi:hypothetical protein
MLLHHMQPLDFVFLLKMLILLQDTCRIVHGKLSTNGRWKLLFRCGWMAIVDVVS